MNPRVGGVRRHVRDRDRERAQRFGNVTEVVHARFRTREAGARGYGEAARPSRPPRASGTRPWRAARSCPAVQEAPTRARSSPPAPSGGASGRTPSAASLAVWPPRLAPPLLLGGARLGRTRREPRVHVGHVEVEVPPSTHVGAALRDPPPDRALGLSLGLREPALGQSVLGVRASGAA